METEKYGFEEWQTFVTQKTDCLQKYGKDYWPLLGVFVALVIEADHPPFEIDGRIIKTGMALISIQGFGTYLRNTKPSIKRKLHILEQESLIKMEDVGRQTIITVFDWAKHAGFYA